MHQSGNGGLILSIECTCAIFLIYCYTIWEEPGIYTAFYIRVVSGWPKTTRNFGWHQKIAFSTSINKVHQLRKLGNHLLA